MERGMSVGDLLKGNARVGVVKVELFSRHSPVHLATSAACHHCDRYSQRAIGTINSLVCLTVTDSTLTLGCAVGADT